MIEPSQSSTTEPTAESLADRVPALTDRRGLLKVAGVVAGAGALAACSSPSLAKETHASSSAGSSAAEGTVTTPAANAGTPTSDIPVGGGKIYADVKVVVTQPTAGTFKAFDAVCPHEGCTVDSIESGQIVCPCHLSHFDVATGDPISGPAQTGLTPKDITVSGGSFTVS